MSILAGIVFYVRRRKQRSSHQAVQSTSHANAHPETEMLEVDWDKIDGQFIQANRQSQTISQAPNEYNLPEGSARHSLAPKVVKPDLGN